MSTEQKETLDLPSPTSKQKERGNLRWKWKNTGLIAGSVGILTLAAIEGIFIITAVVAGPQLSPGEVLPMFTLPVQARTVILSSAIGAFAGTLHGAASFLRG